jgi:hypothetical protein
MLCPLFQTTLTTSNYWSYVGSFAGVSMRAGKGPHFSKEASGDLKVELAVNKDPPACLVPPVGDDEADVVPEDTEWH